MGRGQGPGNDLLDRVVQVGQGDTGGACESFGFGAHVPHLPGGARPGHRGHDRSGGGCYPGGGDGLCVLAAPGGRGDHVVDGGGPAQDVLRLGRPGGSLGGERAGGVLACSGFQGGLLGQVQGLDRRGRAGVIDLELCRQLPAASLDVGPPGGPEPVQGRGDADHLTHWSLGGVGPGSSREPQPQAGAQLGLDPGVVPLAGGDVGLEQDPAVQGQPATFQGLDLVGDRHVGVQVGVP